MRLTAYKKYAFYLSCFGTPKKINNLLLNRSELNNRKVVLKSKPYNITIDPCSNCNLHCPGCHTGIKHTEMLKGRMLRYGNFTKIFDQVKDYVFSVALYNWGEPLLNKDIGKIIEYATQNKVGTTMHSNLNILNEETAETLIRSKLTHLYLSVDGTTQEVYETYRKGGELSNVLKNMKMLVNLKKKTGKNFPIITWKFLEFPHNSHQVNEAKEASKKIGVNNFESFKANPYLMGIDEETNAYKEGKLPLNAVPDVCSKLWNSLYIGPDGISFPCSLCFRKEEGFGNLLAEDINDVWNNDKYINARNVFAHKNQFDNVPSPCSNCKYILKKLPDIN